jgi:basic amino acid/polyamine antiporter, APA family
MFLLSRLAATSAIAAAFTVYLGYFFPIMATGIGRVIALTVLLWGLAWLNLFGVKYGSWMVNFLTIVKIVPLLLFVFVGLFFVDHSRYQILTLPDAAPLKQASLALVFAFGGFENASVPTEEVKNPTRNLPIALVASIALTAALYILIQIVAQGTLLDLAKDATPLASAARSFMGLAGVGIITVGAMLSTAGSDSAVIHPTYHTPYIALVVFAFSAWAIAL